MPAPHESWQKIKDIPFLQPNALPLRLRVFSQDLRGFQLIQSCKIVSKRINHLTKEKKRSCSPHLPPFYFIQNYGQVICEKYKIPSPYNVTHKNQTILTISHQIMTKIPLAGENYGLKNKTTELQYGSCIAFLNWINSLFHLLFPKLVNHISNLVIRTLTQHILWTLRGHNTNWIKDHVNINIIFYVTLTHKQKLSNKHYQFHFFMNQYAYSCANSWYSCWHFYLLMDKSHFIHLNFEHMKSIDYSSIQQELKAPKTFKALSIHQT